MAEIIARGQITIVAVSEVDGYGIDLTQASVVIPSGETSASLTFTARFWKKVGSGSKSAYSCYSKIYFRKDSVYTLAVSTGNDIAATSRNVTLTPSTSYDAIVVLFGASSQVAYNTSGILASREISIVKHGDTGAKGDDAVFYDLVCSPGSLVFRRDALGELPSSLSVTCSVKKRVGQGAVETVTPGAGSGVWLSYRKVGTSGSWQSYSGAVSVTKGQATASQQAVTGVEFGLGPSSGSQAWKTVTVPVLIDGAPGEAGMTGKGFYSAGFWDAGTTYVCTEWECPLVRMPGTNDWYYLKEVGSSTGEDPSLASSTKWARAQNSWKVIMTEMLFADNAAFQSGVITGDWLISKHGTIGGVVVDDQNATYTEGGVEKPYFLKFSPSDPLGEDGTHFAPNYALDLKTGRCYMGDANVRGTVMAENFFHNVCFFKEGGIHSSGWYYIYEETDATVEAGLNVGDYVQLENTISGARPTTYSADLVLCWPSLQNWERPADERRVFLPHPADFEGKMVMVSGFNYGMNSGQFFVCCAAEPTGVSGFFSHGARHDNNGVEFSNRGSSCTLTTGGIAYFISVKEGGNFANPRDAYGWVLVENSTGGDIIIDGGGSVPTSVVRSVVGKTGDVAVGDIAGALTGAGYKLTDTVYSHPTNGANKTINAANGNVLSAITVNSLGHVTSVLSKTLAAADIPNLNASKITAGTLNIGRIPNITVSKISDFPSSMPASDVYAWAKASEKPSYTFSEIGSKPTTLAGYGITDAKISGGVITLGNNTITPITAHQTIYGLKIKNSSNNDVDTYAPATAEKTIKAGSNVTISASNGVITIAATDTKYSSKDEESGGTAGSLVTTGEKYVWNHKQDRFFIRDVVNQTIKPFFEDDILELPYAQDGVSLIAENGIIGALGFATPDGAGNNVLLDNGTVKAIGAANGLATLDGTGKVPSTQLTGELIHYVTEITGTAAVTSKPYNAAIWAGTCPGVTSLYTGLTVQIKVPVAGNGSYGTVLNINEWGNHPVVANVNTMVSNRYTVGCIITLIYDAEQVANVYQNANSATSVTGCWKIADYDSVNIYQLRHGSGTYVAYAAVKRNVLLLQKNETSLLPVNSVGGTGTEKVLTTEAFNPFGSILYWNSTSEIAAAAALSAGSLYQQCTMDLRYSFNTGTTLTTNKDVYMVAELQSDGMAKLASSPISQELPSTDDGKLYIYLGHTYNTYCIELHPVHPIYWRKNGIIQLYTSSEYVLPKATASVLGGVKVGECLSIDSEGNLSATVGEAYIGWGGRNLADGYSPTDAAMISVLGANRAAFMDAGQVTIEYSTDGGSSWVDYGATNSQKTGLFSGLAQSLYVGKNSNPGQLNKNYRLRVTVNTDGNHWSSSASGMRGMYSRLNKFALYISTSGSTSCWCTIEGRLQKDIAGNGAWTVLSNKVGISGWPGYNIINTQDITTYGNNVNTQYGQLRFTLGYDSFASNLTTQLGLTLQNIYCFGGVGWKTPSRMASYGHLYDWDVSQNATFPAKITATQFVKSGGTSTQFLMADGSVKSTSDLQMGEAFLTWGGQNLAGDFSPTDAAMIADLGANRAAFMPAVCSTFEYSRDGGTSWTAYPGATDAKKIGFFSGIENSFTCGYCRTVDGTGPVVGYQLRVTVDAYADPNHYLDTRLRKFVIYVIIGRSKNPWCTIQIRTASNHANNRDTWLTIANKVVLGGDGYNVINTSDFRIYHSSNYRDIRFIFGYDEVNETATSSWVGLDIRKIFFFGGMGWQNFSNMSNYGHIYSYDAFQNATFPAKITATEIVKSGGTGSQLLMANGSVCTLGTGLSMTNGVISVTGSVLPAATASTLGGVMIGAGLSVNNNGLLTADKQLQIYNSGNLLNTVTGLDLPLVSAGASGDPYRMKIDLSGYVSKVMLGTVEYTPSNGVVTLPAYPSGGGGGSSVFALSRNGQSVTLMGSNTSTFYFEEGDGIAMSKIANSSMSGLKVGLGLTQYDSLEDLEYTLYASDARSLADYNALRRIDKTVLSGTITEGQFYSKNDGSVISNTKMKTALYTNVSVSKTYTARGFGLPSSGYTNVAMVHYFHNSTWLGYEESLPTQGPFEQVEELALTLPSNCNRIAICTQISYSPVLVETSLGARINSQDLKDAIAANKAALAELVGSGEGKLMKVTKAGTTIYVRTALNSDEDIITSYIQTDNGNYTWGNTYLGSKNLSDSGIMSNMIHQMGDSTAPLFITDPAPWHLWMQHGYCVPTITATNSLTAADIGSTWKDQNNREYKIGSVSGNLITLLPMVRAYTLEGTVTLQNFYRTNSGALPSLVTNANMKMYEYGVTSELTYKVSGARLPSSGYTNIALVVFLNGTTVLGYDESLPNHGDYTVTDHEITIPTGCNKVIVSTHKDYNVTFAITDVYTRDWKSPTTTNSPSITKLTHVSGATHTSQITASSWSNTQLKPMMTLAARKMTADGREVTEDGVYYCDDFVISEQLNCTDPWTVQTFFPSVVQRNIGAVINETFAIHGMTCRYDTVLDMRKPYIFIAYGASQVQHFVPVEPLEGYDVYGMMPRSKRYYAPYSVNSTSRSGELAIRSETAASGLLVANKQVDRYITFFKNEDTSDMKIGCASGLSLTKGITIDSRRNDVFRVYQTGDDNILSISPANRNKAYFKVLSGTNFTHGVLPGSFIANFSTYMSYFDPMANEGQVYWYKDSGGYVVYAHYQEAYRKVAINLPKEMESLVVSVVDKTDGMTLLTDAVSGGKVYVSADGTESNYIVLKVSFTEEQFQGQYNPV